MKKIFQFRLLISWVIFITGMTCIYFLMAGNRNFISAQQITDENKTLLWILACTAVLSAALNLTSVYKTFSQRISFLSATKLLLLNIPLLLMQSVCIVGMLVLMAVL